MNYCRVTMRNFEEYLRRSDHNTVAKILAVGGQQGFIYECLTESRRYFVKLIVNEKIKTAHLMVYPGITVPQAYRLAALDFCNRRNKAIDVVKLDIDECDSVYSLIDISFDDAPISKETLEKKEQVAIMILELYCDELEQIARGALMLEEKRPSRRKTDPVFDLDEEFIKRVDRAIEEVIKEEKSEDSPNDSDTIEPDPFELDDTAIIDPDFGFDEYVKDALSADQGGNSADILNDLRTLEESLDDLDSDDEGDE